MTSWRAATSTGQTVPRLLIEDCRTLIADPTSYPQRRGRGFMALALPRVALLEETDAPLLYIPARRTWGPLESDEEAMMHEHGAEDQLCKNLDQSQNIGELW